MGGRKCWPGAKRLWLGALLVSLVVGAAGSMLPQVRAEEVAAFCWPAGFFYRLGRLKAAEQDRVRQEIELRLQTLRRQQGLLLVKGEVVETLSSAVRTYAVATILDQSGLVVQVRNFPNLFYGWPAKGRRVNRNTLLVAQNPQMDLVESRIRQHWVITADFVAFSREYLEALAADWTETAPGAPREELR